MNPLTMLFIAALVVALAIVGYLYYERTWSDIIIKLPEVGSIFYPDDPLYAA
jgi:hypothetical protein